LLDLYLIGKKPCVTDKAVTIGKPNLSGDTFARLAIVNTNGTIPVTIIAGPVFNKIAQKIIPSAYTREGDISALGQ
jgi:hypothetical protein